MNTTKTHVSRISIGRVFNLGNYEHVRYEITVDVAEGGNAEQTLVSLENIIADLKPLENAGIPSERELKRQTLEIERLKALSDEQWQIDHQFDVGTREEVTARHVERLAENMRRRAAAIARGQSARQALNQLGGAETYRNAKDQWQDDE